MTPCRRFANPPTRAIRDAVPPAMNSPRQDWLHRQHIAWAGQPR
ncbi:hypothetical protein [Catenuloplanes japonicus]|nr:hypothetical protein [Catenuloplanes japonicus]